MQISEDNFVKELKRRNAKALDYLVDNYSNLIFKVVISVLGSDRREEAVECLNDVLLKVWEKIHFYDENKSKISSWLIAISKYTAIDYKRKFYKVQKQCNLDELMLEDERTIDEQILHIESKTELLNIIKDLGSPDKEIFIRKYFLGESLTQISEAVKLSTSAVNNRLFRGRKIIKDKLTLIKGEVV